MLPHERSQSEKTAYCMIPSAWHSGKANYGNNKKISGCQQGMGGGIGGEGFLGHWQYDTIIMNIYHYTFFQTQRTYNFKSDCNVNLEFWQL